MAAIDLILKNARVITMDPAQPDAELVAVEGDRIVLVGRDDDLESLVSAGTRVIDCQGKTLVPGFNDAHCHIFSFVRAALNLDISPSAVNQSKTSRPPFSERPETPPGRWIIGTGFNEFYLAERRYPTRWEMDEAAPEHPVALLHRSLHACVLNSRALALAGISGETDAPPGATIEREPEQRGAERNSRRDARAYQQERLAALSDTDMNIGFHLARPALPFAGYHIGPGRHDDE